MTKSELVKKFALRTNSSVVSSRKRVDILLEIISEELIEGHPVLLTDFGRLFLQPKRTSLVRRNPQNGIPVEGKPIVSKQSMTIRFKPCKALFERLNRIEYTKENSKL